MKMPKILINKIFVKIGAGACNNILLGVHTVKVYFIHVALNQRPVLEFGFQLYIRFIFTT